ncbi:hypothetical protein MRX96_055403 [Rhipicephalus microplus]
MSLSLFSALRRTVSSRGVSTHGFHFHTDLTDVPPASPTLTGVLFNGLEIIKFVPRDFVECRRELRGVHVLRAFADTLCLVRCHPVSPFFHVP